MRERGRAALASYPKATPVAFFACAPSMGALLRVQVPP